VEVELQFTLLWRIRTGGRQSSSWLASDRPAWPDGAYALWSLYCRCCWIIARRAMPPTDQKSQ